ncbi:hypothetical protein ACM9LZ_22290 [Niveispirillum fermenti]
MNNLPKLTFPRLKSRGLIEASDWQITRLNDDIDFPRLKSRGLIEALAGCAMHYARKGAFPG